MVEHISEDRLRTIFVETLESPARREFIKGIFNEAFTENMQRLGVDIRDPLAQQADMRHLRKWRTIMESGGMKAFMLMVSTVLTGAAITLWAGFKTLVHLP